MWKKFFAPQPRVAPQFTVPVEWAGFFTALLMSPGHFEKAKEFMQSTSLLPLIGEGHNISFSLPSTCPSKVPLTCKLSPVSKAEDIEVDPKDAPPVDSDGSITSTTKNSSTTNTKKTRKRATILVETQVRRSPRVQKNKNGFKDHVCRDKSCLGFNLHHHQSRRRPSES